MSTAAELAVNAGDTVRVITSESDDDLDTDIPGRDPGCSPHDDRSADANKNQSPVRHRVFKTVCLYSSFGAMVRYLESITL